MRPCGQRLERASLASQVESMAMRIEWSRRRTAVRFAKSSMRSTAFIDSIASASARHLTKQEFDGRLAGKANGGSPRAASFQRRGEYD